MSDLTRETVRDPKGAARRVLAMDLPPEVVWILLGLVAVGSLITTLASDALLPDGSVAVMPFFLRSPVIGALFLAAAMAVLAGAVSRLGQLFGGAGDFGAALRLIVWSQVLMVALQVVQTLFLLISPAISALIGVAGFIWFVWLAAVFTAELHGFDGWGKGLVVAVLSLIVTVFVLMFLLVLFGVKPMVEPVNV